MKSLADSFKSSILKIVTVFTNVKICIVLEKIQTLETTIGY